MATIYDYEDATLLADGLQGASGCDEAPRCAGAYAVDRGDPVVLEDDDGVWLVHPDGQVERLREDWA